ncbi:MAG: hypothetical protein LBH43_11670, partial [Treponema sp.]|nr:hypothetical protein [Treponema sp.]
LYPGGLPRVRISLRPENSECSVTDLFGNSLPSPQLPPQYTAAGQAGRPVRGKTGGTRLRNLMALSVIDRLTRSGFVVS